MKEAKVGCGVAPSDESDFSMPHMPCTHWQLVQLAETPRRRTALSLCRTNLSFVSEPFSVVLRVVIFRLYH